MFSNSNIHVSHTFTIIGLIAESTLKFINLKLNFLIIKFENGLKKHVRNVARINHGFVELVVILLP